MPRREANPLFQRPASGQPTRRALLLAGAGLTATSASRSAHAAATPEKPPVVKWRIGHSAPENFPLHIRLLEVAQTIATRSDGQMQLQVFPDGQLGSPIGMREQLHTGAIQAAALTSQVLSGDLAVAALPTVGFAFDGYSKVWAALDGGLGQYIREQLKVRAGIVTLARCWDFGFRMMTTSGNRKINLAEDLVGLRLRSPAEAEYVSLLLALKAQPVAIPLEVLLTSLRSGAVNGQEGALALVQAAGLYEAQTTCALTRHVWDGQWMCIGNQAWSALGDKLQNIVAAAFNDGALKQRQDVADFEANTQKTLQSEGIAFNAVDVASFRSALRAAGYYDAWRKRTERKGWAALEEYTGRLT